MAERDINITVRVSEQGAVERLEEVEGATVDLAEEGGEKGMEFGRTMEVALGNLAEEAARELANQMQALIRQGARLVNRASEINETQNKFNTVFGESSDIVQQFIEDQAQLMGLTQTRAQELLATAGSVAQGAGLAQEASAEMSTEIAQLAGDLASFNNADPQRTFDAITSALTGEREQLKQFGIVIQENMVQQRALQMTGKETTDALTQQEEALASLRLMYEKAGPAVGDLERTSESAANTGRQATSAWKQLRDEFAQELLPVAAEVNTELLELADNEEALKVVRSAAKELSDQLVQGIQLTSDFVQLLVRYEDGIGTAAMVTWTLVRAVGAYVAGAKAYTLWTKRMVIAQKAATIAQSGLNAVMRANPVGLVVSALAVVLPLIWRFRDGMTDAAAAILDFSAKSMRSLQGVVDWIQRLASRIPDALATGPLGLFKTAVQGLDGAVDASANSFEEWAETLRTTGEETEEFSAEMKEAEQVALDYTAATQQNAQAHEESARARREEMSAVQELREAQDKILEADQPQFATNIGGLVGDVGDAREALEVGLINSINAADAAIQNLQEQFDRATTDQARREIQAMIDKLKEQRDQMEGAKEDVKDYDKEIGQIQTKALDAVQKGFLEIGAAIGSSQKTLASFGQAAKTILADLARTLARQFIAMGSAMLLANPAQGAAFIAAGTALQVISASIESSIDDSGLQSDDGEPVQVPSFQTGVTDFEGGLARVHEDEVLANLAPGTSVIPEGSSFPLTAGAIGGGAGGVGDTSSSPSNEALLEELKKTRQAFQDKQFRLRGTDQVTQQARAQAELDDAGIK